MKRYVTECVGTFALVFGGTGAIILNENAIVELNQLGIAIAFGLIVTLAVYFLGNISGAHINPAVSIGFALTGIYKKKSLIPYIIAQLVGAILASGLLKFLFPGQDNLGATIPACKIFFAFFIESSMTFLLMLIILVFSQNKKLRSFTSLAVGFIVFIEAYLAGPITGASMNPARSVGPALASGNISHLWLYISAPITGGLLASVFWLFLKRDNRIYKTHIEVASMIKLFKN